MSRKIYSYNFAWHIASVGLVLVTPPVMAWQCVVLVLVQVPLLPSQLIAREPTMTHHLLWATYYRESEKGHTTT